MEDVAFGMVQKSLARPPSRPVFRLVLLRHGDQDRAMRAAFAITFALLMSITQLSAQTAAGKSDSDEQQEVTRDGLWDGRLAGGNYLVRCSAILALSKHEYIADAAARVVEVNLTMSTSMVIRFYYLEPVRLEGGGTLGAGQQALDKALALAQKPAARVSPSIVEPKVVKNYPASTHAHTIEFVIKDERRLNSLYDSLNRSFRSGQGRIWRE